MKLGYISLMKRGRETFFLAFYPDFYCFLKQNLPLFISKS